MEEEEQAVTGGEEQAPEAPWLVPIPETSTGKLEETQVTGKQVHR